jgi:hypothetical protein
MHQFQFQPIPSQELELELVHPYMDQTQTQTVWIWYMLNIEKLSYAVALSTDDVELRDWQKFRLYYSLLYFLNKVKIKCHL